MGEEGNRVAEAGFTPFPPFPALLSYQLPDDFRTRQYAAEHTLPHHRKTRHILVREQGSDV
jgi:hypothetical protein